MARELRSRSASHRFRRSEIILLALLVLVGLMRGAFWVVTITVWNHVDEMQHYGYVASIATGDGIPIVGRDLVPAEVTLLAKDSTTYGFRPAPVGPEPEDPAWGATAQQYEGIQPPLYYTLMAPVYLLIRPQGMLATVMALRLATLVLSLAAVPLTALLARELFPDRRLAWIAAPALLVTLQAVNGYGAYITNDALTLPMGAAVLVVAARLWRRGPTLGQAALMGVLGGLAFLSRGSIAVLGPLVAAALLGAAVRHRAGVGQVMAWAGIAGGLAAMLGLPWIAWTHLAYPNTNAVAEFNALIGPIVGPHPRTLAGVAKHLRESTHGWFDYQALRPKLGAYTMGALWICGGTLVAGLVGCRRRRDGHGALALLWLAASAPVAVVGMFVVIQVALGGIGGMIGRYLVFTLPPLAVLVAAGLDVALGARWGAVAIAAVATVALTGGARLDRAYVHLTYTPQTTAEVAPVVDQSWHDRWTSTPAIEVRPPCPVRAVTLTFPEAVPPVVWVRTPARPTEDAQLRDAAPIALGGMVGTYTLPEPLSTPFAVLPPDGAAIGVSETERASALELAGAPGDPVARLECAVENPAATRFAQVHALAGVLPIRYGTLMALPIGWAVASWVVLLVLLVGAARGRGRLTPQQAGRGGGTGSSVSMDRTADAGIASA